MLRSLNRANTAKIAQYVDRVIYLGKRNLLFRVDIKHLYSIWSMYGRPPTNEPNVFFRCKTEEDYRLALTSTNHFYNFGRQLSPEGLDKLFVTTLRCNQIDEALELIDGSCNWQRKPPSLHLIYILLNELVSKGDFERLFRLFKIVRKSWQIPLTSTLYEYTIRFMLTTKENPLQEALMIYGDSDVMGVKLTEDTHNLLMEKCLELWSDYPEMCRVTCLYVMGRMLKELGRPASSRTFRLIAWFLYRFRDEENLEIPPGFQHLFRDWRQCVQYCLDLNLLERRALTFNSSFVNELGKVLESFKLNLQ